MAASGTVFLIPSSTGVGWFQNKILRCCEVLDGSVVDRGEKTRGYELSMQGIGYRQKILFLERRPPFKPPIGWPEDRKWSGPAGDSVLIEWRPRTFFRTLSSSSQPNQEITETRS